MLDLQKMRYGVKQGIPTLVIAASSIDDVLAITVFSVLLSVAFASGGIWFIILKGLLDLTIGIVFGLLSGSLMQCLPNTDSKYLSLFRAVFLLNFGLISLFGSAKVGFEGAGALGCLVSACVARFGWDNMGNMQQSEIEVCEVFSVLWFLFQPFLFGLIGAELDLRNDFKAEYIGLAFAVLMAGLSVRTLTAVLVLFRCRLLFKEKLFVGMAWLPKATVQAALGSVTYDTVKEKELSSEHLKMGVQILTVAVLGILVTAPLGATLMKLTAPHLLQKNSKDENECLNETPIEYNINT